MTGGLSAAGLRRLHDVLARHVDDGAPPGLVAAVSRRGQVHVEALGTSTDGGGEPVRADTLFRISSLTKPVTAAATMALVEECLLRLEDPVDALLPELADRRVLRRLDGPLDDTLPADRPVTVHDLLTFTWGFGALFEPGQFPVWEALRELGLTPLPPSPAVPPPPDEWIRRLGTLPLMEQPGARWRYDTGAEVLAVLVARAAGQPFGTVLAERLFGPLGMPDTGFGVPAGAADRFTPCYLRDPETGRTTVYDDVDGQWSRPPDFPSGSAGLVSTVPDYLAFGRMMLDRGRADGGRVLSRPAVELMTTDQLTADQKAASGGFEDSGYGFGVSVLTRRTGLPSVGTFGWAGGLGSSWYADPAEDLVTVLMTNQMWHSPEPPAVFRDFRTAAYAALAD
jgi:CubicO group peptidase (beta-lactamase class C family)